MNCTTVAPFDTITVRVHETMPRALARHRRETGRRGFVFYRFESPRAKACAQEIRGA
jgi:hypothetical protein